MDRTHADGMWLSSSENLCSCFWLEEEEEPTCSLPVVWAFRREIKSALRAHTQNQIKCLFFPSVCFPVFLCSVLTVCFRRLPSPALSMVLKALRCASKYLWMSTQLFCFSGNWVPPVSGVEIKLRSRICRIEHESPFEWSRRLSTGGHASDG